MFGGPFKIFHMVISRTGFYGLNDWHQREPALSAIRCMPWLGIFPPANKLRIGSRAHCLDNGFIIESGKPLQHLKQLVCAFCALWNSAATLKVRCQQKPKHILGPRAFICRENPNLNKVIPANGLPNSIWSESGHRIISYDDPVYLLPTPKEI